MVSHKSMLQHAARTHLANFLRAIGDVPVAANARAAAMHQRARERQTTRRNQHTEHIQVICLFMRLVYIVLLECGPCSCWPWRQVSHLQGSPVLLEPTLTLSILEHPMSHI